MTQPSMQAATQQPSAQLTNAAALLCKWTNQTMEHTRHTHTSDWQMSCIFLAERGKAYDQIGTTSRLDVDHNSRAIPGQLFYEVPTKMALLNSLLITMNVGYPAGPWDGFVLHSHFV